MVDLTISVAEFREKIYEDENLQDFIRDVLVIAGKENSKRALYAIVYILIGKKTFPKALRYKIANCIEQKMIEKTFLVKNNYEQRVYGMLNAKDGFTGEYVDLYYRDVLVNLGKGGQAKKNGRGISAKRQAFIKKELCGYSVLQALNEIVHQFFDKEANGKYDDICDARKRILIMSEHFSVEDFVEAEDKSEDERAIEEDNELSETEKETLILARRGQGRFRADVINRNKCCPFTGVTDSRLLIASHIKPWRESSNRQRLDGNNGFAFTPTYDRLFDQGYISFNDDKKLLISCKLDKECVKALGLQEGKIIERLVLSAKCKEYLEYHREKKFKK